MSFSGEKRGGCGENIGGCGEKVENSGEKCKFAGEKKCIICLMPESAAGETEAISIQHDAHVGLVAATVARLRCAAVHTRLERNVRFSILGGLETRDFVLDAPRVHARLDTTICKYCVIFKLGSRGRTPGRVLPWQPTARRRSPPPQGRQSCSAHRIL